VEVFVKKIVLCLMIVAASLLPTFGQTPSPGKSGEDKIRAELDDVHRQVREAVARRDRTALERLYADEFLLIHTTGGIDTKTERVTKSLTIDPASAPSSAPAQDQVHLDFYRDVAVRTARARVGENRFLWWTWVYVKRDGRWQIARQHGSAIPAARPQVKLDPVILDAYVGRYEYASGPPFTVTRRGGTLVAQRAGRAEVELVPESETQFHVPGGGAIYTFHKGEKGEVTHVIVRRADGQDNRANKVQ
jgi:hypothetical protein